MGPTVNIEFRWSKNDDVLAEKNSEVCFWIVICLFV